MVTHNCWLGTVNIPTLLHWMIFWLFDLCCHYVCCEDWKALQRLQMNSSRASLEFLTILVLNDVWFVLFQSILLHFCKLAPRGCRFISVCSTLVIPIFAALADFCKRSRRLTFIFVSDPQGVHVSCPSGLLIITIKFLCPEMRTLGVSWIVDQSVSALAKMRPLTDRQSIPVIPITEMDNPRLNRKRRSQIVWTIVRRISRSWESPLDN